ncbi:hypothetical protein IAR50_001778 [Cryptococcus sp. DSM 104548]
MDTLIHTSIAVPTLPTIPQSAVPSPTSQQSPRAPTTPPLPIPHPQPSVPFPQRDGTDASGTNRRSSLSRMPPAEGSYFPPTPSPTSKVASSSLSPGNHDRPRPPPLMLPTGSPDEADYGATPTTKGKGKEKAWDLVSDSPEKIRPACEIDREDPEENVALCAVEAANPQKSPSASTFVRMLKKRSSGSLLGDRSDEGVLVGLRQTLSGLSLKGGSRRPMSKSPETTFAPLEPLPSSSPELLISPRTRSRSFDGPSIDFSVPPSANAESSLRRSKTVSHPQSPKPQSLLFTGEISPRHDEASVETHTSVSAGAFSPMSLTNNHPLSSATTSLSRSAKSGKEGQPGKVKERDSEDSLDSVKQWNTKQKVHHDRLELRRLSLLELVEKTLSHSYALKVLETIYLSPSNSVILPFSAAEEIRKLRPLVARIRKVNDRIDNNMVSVLKEEGIGYERSLGKRKSEGDVFETKAEREQQEMAHMDAMGEEFEEKLDRAISKISIAMLAEEKGFRKYTKLCVTGVNASKVLLGVSKGDRERFEARCQIQVDTLEPERRDLPARLETSSALGLTSISRRRLHFEDFLHAPYQRIPGLVLLLQRVQDSFKGLPIKVGDEVDGTSRAYADVARLREMIQRVGSTTDSARGVKEKEEATETLISRIDANSGITPEVLRSLGICRLIGSLNVLYQHIEPLPKQATVKHLAAFLYDGYLILAKVKKNQKVYEPRHFFPLSMFVMYGVTTGPISPSIRLESGRFSYFLGTPSAEELRIWKDALDVARDKIVSPYAVPTSIPVPVGHPKPDGWVDTAWGSPDVTKFSSSPLQTPMLSRRASLGATKSLDLERIAPATRAKRQSPEKRHTMTNFPTKSNTSDDILTTLKIADAKSKHDSEPSTPVKSPGRAAFSSAMTPDRISTKESTQTLKQPQKNMIDNVMHGLEDIFDSKCGLARSGENIRKSHSMGTASRRKSTTQLVGFKDSIGATVFTGAVTESVIPKREPTVGHVKGKPSLPDDWQPGEPSELPRAIVDSDEEEEDDEDDEEESGGTSRPISEFGASRQPLTRNGSSTSLFGPTSRNSFSFLSASNDDYRNSLGMRTKRDKTRKGAALAEKEIAKEKEKDPVGHAKRKSETTRRKISGKEGMAHYTHIREKSQPASPMLSPAHEQPSFEISLRHEDEQAVYDSGATTAPAEDTREEMVEYDEGMSAPGLKRRSFSYDATPTARRPGPSRRLTPPEYQIPEPHGPAPVQPLGASFGGFFDRSRKDSDRSRRDSDRSRKDSRTSDGPGGAGLSRRSSFVSVKSSLKRSLSGISLLSTRKSPSTEAPEIGTDEGTGSSAQSTPGTEFSPMSPVDGLYGAEEDHGRDALEMKRVAPTRQKSFKNLYGLGFSSMRPDRG